MKKHLSYRLCAAIAGIGAAMVVIAPAQAFTFGSRTPSTGTVGNVGNYTSIGTVGITADDIGKSFQVNWSLPESGTRQAMGATGLFTVNNFTTNALSLTVKLTNTTASSFQAALMSMGLGVSTSKAKAAYTGTGSKFDSMTSGAEQNFPGGFKNIDVCIFAANKCSGGNINEGIQSGGESDTFTFDIFGPFGTKPSVTLDSFAAKFQTQVGSFEFPGVEIKDVPPPPPPPRVVPEPGTVAGLGAIAGLVAIRRRKSK